MSRILLVPVPPADHHLIVSLQARLASAFRAAVELYPKRDFSPASAFDFGRNQFNSTVILGAAIKRFDSVSGKILCVTALDLFVPVLTFVFGEAQLDGSAAIVSSHRLDDSFYGLPKNQRMLEERLFKEAVHELGHTYGLVHCHDYDCVMHSSTSVEEIDLKGTLFCPGCSEYLLRHQVKAAS